MSFLNYKEFIEDGDTVILYLGFNRMKALKIKKGETYQTKYGCLRHNNMIGKPYGSKVKCSDGFLHVLHVTPELWTMTLPHRTQILYSTDISMIILQLDLRPGSIVVESGTGSGSLSHALIRSVAPSGHLHTFDFHEQRVETARQEFETHGLGHLVTVRQKDVCGEGYDLEDIADAVFLDLPSPWDVLPHAKKAIKREGGRLCSFSPCIEQVQRTCEQMMEIGFCEVETFEVLVRDYSIQTIQLPVADMGFGVGEDNIPGLDSTAHTPAGSREPFVGQLSGFDVQRMDTEEKGEPESNKSDKQDNVAQNSRSQRKGHHGHLQHEGPLFKFKSALPVAKIPGHTGYLTFATLFPYSKTS